MAIIGAKNTNKDGCHVDDIDKFSKLEQKIGDIISIFDLVSKDSSINDTPKRVAKMLINELFIGLDEKKFPDYKMFDVSNDYKEPIVVNNIEIYSICEHHLLPFTGTAVFSYVPNKQVIGLSKIPRIIDFLARKPNLQERLTLEIFDIFSKILNTNDISVELKCEHLCAKMRGIKSCCEMITSKKGGVFLL